LIKDQPKANTEYRPTRVTHPPRESVTYPPGRSLEKLEAFIHGEQSQGRSAQSHGLQSQFSHQRLLSFVRVSDFLLPDTDCDSRARLPKAEYAALQRLN
jgi:hypothetical protein